MQVDNFITNLREQYELLEDDVVITQDTKFKDLDDWDSLVALSVIAMADDEYEVTLTGDDIRSVSTVKELYDLVQSKASDNG